MTHNVTLASLIMYILFATFTGNAIQLVIRELIQNHHLREKTSAPWHLQIRMYCKTHVLELELQGVTWADNGQDCCRLVTRVRNLPINQHDRSCSPGTSETGASSCWWRPRRRQAPDCWLQGLYFLATVWKQTAIVKGQILRRTNELYALFRTTNLNIPIPTAQNGCRTLGCLTQVVQY